MNSTSCQSRQENNARRRQVVVELPRAALSIFCTSALIPPSCNFKKEPSQALLCLLNLGHSPNLLPNPQDHHFQLDLDLLLRHQDEETGELRRSP